MIRPPTTLSSSTTVQLAHRLLIRRDHETWPFFWRGMAPAFGLAAVLWYALWPFRTDGIAHTVRQEVRAELDARQLGWVKVEVDGQEVRLGGRPPNEAAAKAALAAAADTRCRTWLVAVRCVTAVQAQFNQGPISAADEPEPVIRLTPDAATPGPSLSSEATGPSRVLAPARSAAKPERGDAERSPGVAIAQGASVPLAEPTTARGCEARIAGLLSGASIQFTSGEASIDPGSDGLLDRISQAIRACPGVVRIEGHSDTSGRGASNEALSEARARAVREVMVQLGVAEDKVVAAGMGSTRPVAPNDTPEGRALNRRIEFHALEPNR